MLSITLRHLTMLLSFSVTLHRCSTYIPYIDVAWLCLKEVPKLNF